METKQSEPVPNEPAAPTGALGWPLAFGATLCALLISNGCWLYHAFDTSVSLGYLGNEYRQTCSALKEALGTLPRVARGASADSIVAAALDSSSFKDEPLKKDGKTIVGYLTFTFDEDGALRRAGTIWELSGCGP